MTRLFFTSLLLAILAPGFAGETDYNDQPSNPNDIEANRVYRQKIQADGGHKANREGVVEPMLSQIEGRDLRIPHTKQVGENGQQLNLLKSLPQEALGAVSATGHVIEHVGTPHHDLFTATRRLSNNARLGIVDHQAAGAMLDVLLGRTEGQLYDGFPLLNFNRFNSEDVPAQAYTPGTAPGEYKMKTLRFTGDKEPSWKDDGTMVNVWEIDVNMLWYDQQFDSDTFLIKIPYLDEASGLQPQMDDTLRINYVIYSLVEEDFSPTQVMLDAQAAVDYPGRGSVRFPYKGEDTVWERVNPQTKHQITVQHTALRFIRGIYIWGWNVHPPRIQFMQPVQEVMNVLTNQLQYEPQGESFVVRNRNLELEHIGDAAPEKKLYQLAKAVLAGDLSAQNILSWLEDPDVGPAGVWQDWMATQVDHRRLPPEARAMLAAEGKSVADYDFVTVYLNNEMYGRGPLEHTIKPWSQGDHMNVRLINLDHHTHYFRNVGFGATLHNDFTAHADDGVFSFEIMNFKPLYGAPKVAEMQWRAGWGFRPHYSVVQQNDVFPRPSDRRKLTPYVAPNERTGKMDLLYGYQYSKEFRDGDFPFNPPNFIITTTEEPAFDRLYDLQPYNENLGSSVFLSFLTDNWDWAKANAKSCFKTGLVIGQKTEGFGLGRMCEDAPPGFCPDDLSQYHWRGLKNWPAPNDPSVPKTELRFPPFLRNPNQEVGGDIIPPTWVWKPFLWINPKNGTLYNDADDPSKGYWSDHTFSHGRPIYAGDDMVITIEMPRAAGQLFYQFDDLFHDNAIFSPHPIK